MGVREDRLAAVLGRLEQVRATQDLSPVLEPGGLAEAERLAEILQDDYGDLQSRYLLGVLYWFRSHALPQEQDRLEAQCAAIDMFTPCFIAEVGDLPESLLPILAEQAVPTATAWLHQALGSPDPDPMAFSLC